MAAALLATSCSADDPRATGSDLPTETETDETIDAGDTTDAGETSELDLTDAPAWLVARSADAATTFEVSDRSYNLSARNIGLPARFRFVDGDLVFEETFQPDTGLGPDFNADGCLACHVNNGRTAAPIESGQVGIGPVVHVSTPGASADEAPFELPGYGTRLQTSALEGEAEATVEVSWEEIPGTYPDGTQYSLRAPTVSVVGRLGELPADAEISIRIPPPIAGPGLLEFVPADDILALVDPDDSDGDGISGRVQWSPSDDGSEWLIGRHGWKAENFDLAHQSAGALADDIGIGTSLKPVNGEIEITDKQLADLAFYIEAMAIPAGRDIGDPDVIAGAVLFESIGCASCHTPEARTGSTNTAELDNLTIYPFTDLLLHDLGPGLDDGRRVLQASGAEWRTAPLWGVGLLETVNGHWSLLHDGRARSIEEAILWHGGEAELVSQRFKELAAADRAQLIRFVESR